MPSICERSTPVSWWSGVRRSKRGSLCCGFCRRRAAGSGLGGHGRSRCEPGQVAFDRRIARGELSLIGVEEFQVLLEAEDVFGSVIAA